MSVIEKLKEAVRSVVEAEKINLYKEARLEDGRLAVTESDDFTEGAAVSIMSDDGEAQPLPPGSYPLSDGGELKIGEDGKVVLMEDKEEKEEMNEEKEEEKDEMGLIKAALIDKFQITPEVAEEIVEVVKEVIQPAVEEVVEEVKEEVREEMTEEKPVEMSSHISDLTHEMAVALEAINKRLSSLEDAPAAQPDRVLPKAEFKQETNPNLKGVDRALNLISQYS